MMKALTATIFNFPGQIGGYSVGGEPIAVD